MEPSEEDKESEEKESWRLDVGAHNYLLMFLNTHVRSQNGGFEEGIRVYKKLRLEDGETE